MGDPEFSHSTEPPKPHYPRLVPGENTSHGRARCAECGRTVVMGSGDHTYPVRWEGETLRIIT